MSSYHLPTNQKLELFSINQSEVSITLAPQYRWLAIWHTGFSISWCLLHHSTAAWHPKLSSLSAPTKTVNQSEISIVWYQPIRDDSCFVSTNQKRVFVWFYQSEESIYLSSCLTPPDHWLPALPRLWSWPGWFPPPVTLLQWRWLLWSPPHWTQPLPTNNKWEFFEITNQMSELFLYQPIRKEKCFVLTNQKWELYWVNQSEESIYLPCSAPLTQVSACTTSPLLPDWWPLWQLDNTESDPTLTCTNQRSVLWWVNQSVYYYVSTNQRRVILCFNQSEMSALRW